MKWLESRKFPTEVDGGVVFWRRLSSFMSGEAITA